VIEKQTKKLEELTTELETGDNTKFLFDYCKLGHCYYGVLDEDDIDNVDYENDDERRKQILRKMRRNETFRIILFNRICSCIERKHISEIQQIVKDNEEKIRKLKKDTIDEYEKKEKCILQ